MVHHRSRSTAHRQRCRSEQEFPPLSRGGRVGQRFEIAIVEEKDAQGHQGEAGFEACLPLA
jgi:hypothetical protein